MCPYEYIDLAFFCPLDNVLCLPVCFETVEHLDADGKIGKTFGEGSSVLDRKHRCRDQNSDLFSIFCHLECRAHRKFGFAVSGVVEKKNLLKAGGAKAGDILVLTKPLGTGILTSAVKKGKAEKYLLQEVIDSMLSLNKTASKAAVSAGARAATDVTGFGLLGHAFNMAKGSKINLKIYNDKVPLMSKVKELASAGVVPKGAVKNLEFCSRNTQFSENIGDGDKLALSDPQTSGGLLIALPSKGLKKFDQAMKKGRAAYQVIGEVVKGDGKIIVE